MPGTLAESRGVSSKRAERPFDVGVAASKLPTIDFGGLDILRRVGGSGRPGVCSEAGEGVCGWSWSLASVAMGDTSGDGESEGNEVRLLSSEGVPAALASEALEAAFRGRVRLTVEDLRLLEEAEVVEEVRQRRSSLKESIGDHGQVC